MFKINDEINEIHGICYEENDRLLNKRKISEMTPKLAQNNKMRESLFSFEKQHKNFQERENYVKVNILIRSIKENKYNISKSPDDIIITIDLLVEDNLAIADLIKISLENFNQKFKQENLKFLLNNSNDYKSYNLKASKKSGYPNSDIPGNQIHLN